MSPPAGVSPPFGPLKNYKRNRRSGKNAQPSSHKQMEKIRTPEQSHHRVQEALRCFSVAINNHIKVFPFDNLNDQFRNLMQNKTSRCYCSAINCLFYSSGSPYPLGNLIWDSCPIQKTSFGLVWYIIQNVKLEGPTSLVIQYNTCEPIKDKKIQRKPFQNPF